VTGPRFVAAIDQGTTSSRCIVFDHEGRPVADAQREFTQVFPRPGWVEHDPAEIWSGVEEVVAGALERAGATAADLAAVGITNQRETTVLWEAATGEPVGNAIVWQDTRTADLCRELEGAVGQNRFLDSCGLPLATYFSGPKIAWLLAHTPGLRERAEAGEVLFGTVESWLIWKLTGEHVTDVTNASRTMLMNLRTLDWDHGTLEVMGIPAQMLPRIVSSAQVYGQGRGVLAGVPVAAALGDQQAALFGQCRFEPGEAKNTYGTGSFLLVNTGPEPVFSKNGLLTTVGYRIGDQPPVYALEGSIAITGALVQWLRDNLGLISEAAQIEELAASVDDNGGCYIVPAFSGLFAPYWRSDARGAIVGLTRYVNKGHLARAALEATAWQTREIVDAMNTDSGVELTSLRVDGGMVVNDLLMQIQADVLGVPVIRPQVAETTALGAAYAAGLATRFWSGPEELRGQWREDARWEPRMAQQDRERQYADWRKAVTRTFDWVAHQ
jgi:glycerol kinase